MVLFKIAWRNVWRSKLRSLVMIGAITVGLWLSTFIMGFYTGIIDQRISSIIESEISHLQFHHPEFRDNYLPSFTIDNSEQVLAELENDERVEAYSGRVIASVMINSPTNATGVRVRGIDPEKEDALTTLSEKVTQGAYFEGINKNPILISERLAEKLDVEVEKKVVLTFQDVNNDLVSGAFRIVGLYKTVNGMYDETNVFVRQDDIATLLGTDGQVHEIAVMLHDIEGVEPFVQDQRGQYPGTDVETWMDLSPEIRFALDMMDEVLMIIVGIILLALMFGVINTMLMAVLERKKELGVLMAVGLNRRRVFGMILLETTYLSFVGAVLGMLLGWLVVNYFGSAGIDLSVASETLEEFGYSSMIYPKLESIQFVNMAIMVFTMAIVASIFPAINALRLNPVEAIRKI